MPATVADKQENICNTPTHFDHGVFNVFAVRRDGPVFLATRSVGVTEQGTVATFYRCGG